ncbi:MAG: VWA domain-containing protein [Proteobacteria bacterium]|nr:VWA domain-containing protein [Pseudomonadota bacterium]
MSGENAGREADSGRLAENILMFCRTLRNAGLPIGPGRVLDAMTAVRCAGIDRRDDFYWALRAVLVSDPAQFRLFDQAFHVYFRNPRLLERMMSLLLPTLETDSLGGTAADAPIRRLREAMSGTGRVEVEQGTQIGMDQSGSWSRREVLRRKDFEEMSLEEQSEADELLRAEILSMANVATRRFRFHPYGNRYDLRRSMRLILKNNGQLIELVRKRRLTVSRPLVLICDISGSMSRYSRVFLYFAHVMTARQHRVHTFVFGTRLTNITRRLADKDIDRALAAVSADVKDWDGGTRIAECLERFNVDWSRRVLAQSGIVVLLSDGLERDSRADLGFQMQRLHRSCRQLIWLNPMLRYSEFEPRAMGIRTMLPHVDLFLPAHNIESLGQLSRLLQQDTDSGRVSRSRHLAAYQATQ